MKININKLQEKIHELQELGFDFDFQLFGDETKGFAREIESYIDDKGDIEFWILIREFGNHCLEAGISIVNCKRYSKNTSTIIYEQFFLNNTLSYIFEELTRITNGKFEYEVIKEFGSQKNDKELWMHLGEKQGDDHFHCEYIIGGKHVNIRYDFFKPEWSYLDPEFLPKLIKNNLDYLNSVNINYLDPEEFMTFFCIDKANQRLLKNKPSVFINNDLSFEQVQKNNNMQRDKSVYQTETSKKWWEFWK